MATASHDMSKTTCKPITLRIHKQSLHGTNVSRRNPSSLPIREPPHALIQLQVQLAVLAVLKGHEVQIALQQR